MSDGLNRATPSSQQQTSQTSAGDKVFTFWQATTLLPSTLLGVSLLTLPRVISPASGGGGIILVIVDALYVLLIVWMYTILGQKFPGKTIVAYTQKLFSFGGSKRLGYWLALPYMASIVLWWIITVSSTLRIFGEAQRSVVFPQTPLWFMVGTMLFVGALVAANRAEVIARLNEIVFPIIIVPLVIIGIMALAEAEWTNLLPLFHITWKEFWRGAIGGIGIYQGVSVILIFMASYQQPQKAMRSHSIGIGLVMAVYVLGTVASLATFPHKELEQFMWPTLDMVKNTRLPGVILERVESGFLAVWVVAVFTTVANLLTAAVHMINEYLGIKPGYRMWILLPLAIIVYVLALWPQDIHAAFRQGEIGTWFGIVLGTIIPPSLLLIALIRRIGNGSDQQRQNGKLS